MVKLYSTESQVFNQKRCVCVVQSLVLMVKKNTIISERAHFYDVGLNIALGYKHGPTCLLGVCVYVRVFS